MRRVKEGTSAVLLQSGLDEKMVGGFRGMPLLSAETFKIFWQMGRQSYERRLGVPFDGPVIPFGVTVEYHPISLRQFGPKVLPDIFLGNALHPVGIWKGDIMVANIQELEQMDASEIHAKRLTAKEVFTPMKGENIHFNLAQP